MSDYHYKFDVRWSDIDANKHLANSSYAVSYTHLDVYKRQLQTLNHILKIEDIKSVFCWDADLKNFLNVVKVPYTTELELFNDCAFITCEYLIAYDGRIMLSYNNILHYHSSRLPEKIILMANVSQIVTLSLIHI